MKKILISILCIVMFIASSTQFVYADETWVQDAFSAARSFMDEKPEDTFGIGKPILTKFKSIVKGLNLILIVVLAGLSAISLSIIGVRYIASGALPKEKAIAKENLKKVFTGMAYGFGAFMIWRISMGIVELIISSF